MLTQIVNDAGRPPDYSPGFHQSISRHFLRKILLTIFSVKNLYTFIKWGKDFHPSTKKVVML